MGEKADDGLRQLWVADHALMISFKDESLRVGQRSRELGRRGVTIPAEDAISLV